MTITTSEAQRHLLTLIEKVNKDHTPVEIVSDSCSAVLVAKTDYDSWVETITESIEQAKH